MLEERYTRKKSIIFRVILFTLVSCMIVSMLPSGMLKTSAEALSDTEQMYLSDLNWFDLNLINYSTGWGALGLDKDANNEGPISLGGKTYQKGLGAHASSAIHINVAEYQPIAFLADIGINDNQGNMGKATFIVEADGVELFRSDELTGADAAVSVRVDIPAGTEVFTLITDKGKDDICDHTVWADALFLVPAGIEDIISNRKIQNVMDLISAIGTVTADAVDRVEAARKAYDALMVTQKENVLNYPVLEAAEAKLIELGAAIEQRKTPLMGWSAWNCFYDSVNEEKLMPQLDALVSTGLAGLGYTYFNLDDAWQNGRSEDGTLLINTTKFPGGIKQIADRAHALGLKAGIYSDAGEDTCSSYGSEPWRYTKVGLYGYMEQDLEMFMLDWGFDFIKVDWCGGTKLGLDRQTEYTKISECIKQVELKKGEDIIYNVCCWAFPGEWVTSISDYWRISGDITCDFDSILTQLDTAAALAQYQSPGHVNDPDMLQVGNGMTYDEDKSHFTMWCMLSAPLMIGTNLLTIRDETLSILSNEELIAVDQDPACIMAALVKEEDSVQTWVKPLGSENSNEKVVTLLNRNNHEVTATVRWEDLGFVGDIEVRDLWAHEDLTVADTYTVTLPAHGCVTLKIVGETGTSASILKSAVSAYPETIDVDAVGKLDWANVETGISKEDAYVISHADSVSAGIKAITSQRTARFYITTDGQATVTAVLNDKQTSEVLSGSGVYTVTYAGELGGPDLELSVEGGRIELVAVSAAEVAAVHPESTVLIATNGQCDKTAVDGADGTVDYIRFREDNGNVSVSNSGILTDFVTGIGGSVQQTEVYDFFEIILPATEDVLRADIYYTLTNVGVNIAVEGDGDVRTLSAYGAQGSKSQVLSVYYTSPKEVRVTVTLTNNLDDDSSMVIQAVALSACTDNQLVRPTVKQEGYTLTWSADTVVVDEQAADEPLYIQLCDSQGVVLSEESREVTPDSVLNGTVKLPDGFTAGSLTFRLWGQEYTFALPLDDGYIASDSTLVGTLLAQKLVKDGAILLDVRTEAEYAAGHIDGAVHLLYTDVMEKATDILPDKSVPIVVYCSAGKRSAQAQMALRALGYTAVYNIGPMENWYIVPSISIRYAEQTILPTDPISVGCVMNPFETDWALYYAFGEEADFADAKPVPNSRVIYADEGNYLKVYLTWKGEIVALWENELPMLHNEEIPQVDIDVYLSEMDWLSSTAAYGQNQRDVSTNGNALTIAGLSFEKGIGTHASSSLSAEIPAGMTRFLAVGGMDDEVSASATRKGCRVQAAVYIDDVLAEESLELISGYYHVFDVEIPEGAKVIRLETYNTDDGVAFDHFDWAIAGFVSGDSDAIKGWHTVGTKTYYYVNGEAVKGLQKIGDDFYYFSTGDGNMKKDCSIWVSENDLGLARGAYNVGADGKLQLTKNGLVVIGEKTYCFVNDEMQYGLQKIGNDFYYFHDKAGYMYAGLSIWVSENGLGLARGRYNVGEDGKIQVVKNGWLVANGKTYYYVDDVALTGAQKIGDDYYYFSTGDGSMKKDGAVIWVPADNDGGVPYGKYIAGADGKLQLAENG